MSSKDELELKYRQKHPLKMQSILALWMIGGDNSLCLHDIDKNAVIKTGTINPKSIFVCI